MGKIIGIDLGTTNSCVAVMEGGQPTVIRKYRRYKNNTICSSIYKDRRTLIGEPAKRQAVTNAEKTIASIKREMGTDYKVQSMTKKYSPQEISAMIFRN